MKLILGSASPRRRDLLAQIGIVPHDIRPADIDETPLKGELPRVYAIRLAAEKARAIHIDMNEIVLSADTVVAVGRRILGKPSNAAQAREYLNLLSGRRHRVITAIALRSNDHVHQRDVMTAVRFKNLSPQEVDQYIQSDEWDGKAGGYAIQGIASAFIPAINGSYTNVVGLPLAETAAILASAGLPVSFKGQQI